MSWPPKNKTALCHKEREKSSSNDRSIIVVVCPNANFDTEFPWYHCSSNNQNQNRACKRNKKSRAHTLPTQGAYKYKAKKEREAHFSVTTSTPSSSSQGPFSSSVAFNTASARCMVRTSSSVV